MPRRTNRPSGAKKLGLAATYFCTIMKMEAVLSTETLVPIYTNVQASCADEDKNNLVYRSKCMPVRLMCGERFV